MRQMIDCFIACNQMSDAEQAVAQLRDNKTIHNIFLLVSDADVSDSAPKDCQLLPVSNLTSSQTIMRIAENAAADYVLLQTKAVRVTFGSSALERLLRVASDSGT